MRMTDLWTFLEGPKFGILVGFHVFILLMLVLDLGVFQRKGQTPSFKAAALWSAVWIVLALVFALGIWKYWGLWKSDEADRGTLRAGEFVTGYLVELSLSVDNLF